MIDLIQISALNQFLYCERRAGLMYLDGVFKDNEHTILGQIVHEQVDTSGYEHRAGWKLLRALPVYSNTLGVNGKADLVEVKTEKEKIIEARPVEYKKGKTSKWVNDNVQLCAQMLCLEEMFEVEIPEGMIFHASSNKRTKVIFDDKLRKLTKDTISNLRKLIELNQLPHAELKPQCRGCSLHEICMPEITINSNLKENLYKVM